MQEHTPFDLPDRFWAKTREDENGCLIWTGAVQSSGYGCYGYNGGTQLVHRLVYMAAEGADSIPQGWHIDHLCRVRLCVNIDHLEAVTPAENNRRMIDVLTVKYPHGRCYPTVTHVLSDEPHRRVSAVHVDRPYMRQRCPHCPDKAA